MQLKLRVFLKWAALFFLALESLGLIASALALILTMAYRNEAHGISGGQITLELALRIVIVGFILLAYLNLRKVSRLPLVITRQSALLTSRAVQSVLIAVIALYALVGEKISGLENGMLRFPAWSLGLLALASVVSIWVLRNRFLDSANERLRRDPNDATALTRWRKTTIMSLVLAMSVGLYGFILRMTGDSQLVEWLFFLSSIGLLLLWGPRLDDATYLPPNQLPNEAKS